MERSEGIALVELGDGHGDLLQVAANAFSTRKTRCTFEQNTLHLRAMSSLAGRPGFGHLQSKSKFRAIVTRQGRVSFRTRRRVSFRSVRDEPPDIVMKILVAGATGAIGLPLVRALCTLGHKVTGMTRAKRGIDRLREVGAEVSGTDAFDF